MDRSECVLIVAPLGADAPVIAALLSRHGYQSRICNGARGACTQLAHGAGALILTDEALEQPDTAELFATLSAQPAWSELPLVVLTSGRGESRFERFLEWLNQAAGSITVLERPISTLTLLRAVQVALRSRRRQYQVRDLLEAQRVREAALQQSEERWRLALEGAGLGSWDIDLRTGEAVWNQRHSDFLGYRHPHGGGPATFEIWRQRVHPDDLGHMTAEIERARREHQSVAVEHRLRSETGDVETRWLALYGRFYYDSAGDAVRVSGVSRDVTDEKRTARQMRVALEAQARLAAIVNSSVDAIVGEDLTGLITTWNRGARQLYGYEEREVIGSPVLRLIPPELQHEQKHILASINRGEAIGPYETVRLRKDGTRVHVSLGVSPILDTSGVIIGAAKIARDITQAVEARAMQLALTEQLQEYDRRKNEFLATLSHELRNPLAPIRNTAQILTSSELSPEQLKSCREIIQRQVTHMARLLEDLLDISRVTHGKLTLQRSRVSLSTIVDAAVETVQPLIASKKHDLVVRLPSDNIDLDGDAIRLTQVFGNLLTNAAKYTESRGLIEIVAELKQGTVAVTVRDNGIGIPPDVLPKVFEMFTQASDARPHAQGGLGIGLALTKGLVELHGGAITADSRPGGGSEFIVTLPATAGAPAQRQVQSRHEPDESRRILVVDDNQDAADSLALLLRSQGHAVSVAYSGEQALDSARVFRPEVALLDIGMPDMDGYELARRIRQQPWGTGLRLLAVTGRGQDEDRRRTLNASFECHLVKPVGLEQIRSVLVTAPARSSAAR